MGWRQAMSDRKGDAGCDDARISPGGMDAGEDFLMECTDIFWHQFYKGAGVTLGVLLPLLLGFGAVMLMFFRQQYRHEEAMQEARMRAYEVRDSHYRVIQGGQG